MNKRQLHHFWTKLRRIHPVYFLILTILSGVVAIFALRTNNQQMIQLRDAVYAADKNNSDVQTPLKALQAYVTTHMNTDLTAGQNAVYPPIQLKYTYERLTSAQNDLFLHANSQVYSDAQKLCEQQNPTDFSGRNRVPCIEAYVLSHTVAKPANIPDALYKFSFVSPRWSPDLAGWSIVVAVLSGTTAAFFFITNRWFRKHTA
ncbi:hypothetical protein COY17_03715 [Candidatus Saccharibacteria bacterium CG_4_10_14_0_2_um_filter_52_9]|nr:MAG: hypothetical protein COY17_03715 [Candidatus Saccharibacteria bacterium CG_4_10_14_0_2_um_filter_52_9]